VVHDIAKLGSHRPAGLTAVCFAGRDHFPIVIQLTDCHPSPETNSTWKLSKSGSLSVKKQL